MNSRQDHCDALSRLLQKAADDLGEHFDSVQILASFNSEKITSPFSAGRGCFYSRVGLAREFLIRDSARTAADEVENPPPDDDDIEAWL